MVHTAQDTEQYIVHDTEQFASRQRLPLLAAALATVYLVWGSTYLALWIMVEEMPPLLGSGLRALAAAGLLALVLAVVRRGWRCLVVTPRQLAGCALLGLLLPAAGQGLVTVAEDGGAPSGLTALLVASVPLWIIAFQALSGDRSTTSTVLGVVVGFAGVAVLVAHHGVGGSVPTWTLLAVVSASAAWALGSWLLPRLGVPGDPFVVVVYEMLVGGSVLVAAGVVAGERFSPVEYSLRSWGAWAYLVVVGSIVAFSAYAWLLQSTSVSVVSTYAYVSPVVAVVLGWLVLGEVLTSATLTAAALIVCSVALVVSSERPEPSRVLTPRFSGFSGFSMTRFAIVHAAGDSGWAWHLVERELRILGHFMVAPDLPADATATLSDYADVVLDAIGASDDHVVVVGHSFGAFTAPIVADRLPSAGLVLVAGMIPRPGEAPVDWWTTTGHAEAAHRQAATDGGLTGASDPLVCYYHDVPEDLAERALRHQRDHPSPVANSKVWPLAAMPAVPTRFVLCTQDRLFPAAFMRQVAQERLGTDPDEIDSGHCPNLSRPADLAAILNSCAASFRATS